MTSFFKTAAAAALTGTALFLSAPARADDFSVSIGVPGVAFSYDSGGFCDPWGCPEDYWDYPIYYGPVYYGDEWFDGPVYYEVIDGDYWYWVHGGWHRDAWHGPRPYWWGHYRYGPALGYTFYSGHGFHHGHDGYWHGNDWHPDHGNHDGWHGGDHRGWDRHDGGDRGRFDHADRDRHDDSNRFQNADRERHDGHERFFHEEQRPRDRNNGDGMHSFVPMHQEQFDRGGRGRNFEGDRGSGEHRDGHGHGGDRRDRD